MRKFCNIFYRIALVLAVAVPILSFILWLNMKPYYEISISGWRAYISMFDFGKAGNLSDMPFHIRLLTLPIWMIPICIGSYLLWTLHRVLKSGAQGVFLSKTIIDYSKRLAWVFLVFLIASRLSFTAISGMLSGVKGDFGLSWTSDMHDLQLFVCAAVFLVLTHMLEIGNRAQLENSEFL